MCTGAIVQSRINTIYYAADNPNFGDLSYLRKYNKQVNIYKGLLEKDASDLLKKFFKEKRK